jgi:hypothetical protein
LRDAQRLLCGSDRRHPRATALQRDMLCERCNRPKRRAGGNRYDCGGDYRLDERNTGL